MVQKAPVPKNLAVRHSNAHAYRLYVFKDPDRQHLCFLSYFAAISEALNYDTYFKSLSNFRVSIDPVTSPTTHSSSATRPDQQSLRFYTGFSTHPDKSFDPPEKESRHHLINPAPPTATGKLQAAAAKPSNLAQVLTLSPAPAQLVCFESQKGSASAIGADSTEFTFVHTDDGSHDGQAQAVVFTPRILPRGISPKEPVEHARLNYWCDLSTLVGDCDTRVSSPVMLLTTDLYVDRRLTICIARGIPEEVGDRATHQSPVVGTDTVASDLHRQVPFF